MKIKGIIVPPIDLSKISGENYPDLFFMMKCCLFTIKCSDECITCLYSIENFNIFKKTINKYWLIEKEI